MFSKIGRLFKKSQHPFSSKSELFASFMAIQFLERGWDLPKELIDECLEGAGPDFRPVIRGWILVYCAWLFRLASIRQFRGTFEKDMMAALRVRLLKPEVAQVKDLVEMFEFWFGKLDIATSETMKEEAPTINGEQVPSTYFAALAFIALDPNSPWHMDENAPNDAIAGVAIAISRVQDRMIQTMPQLVERMAQRFDALAA
jgi:hypothetical protein